ncbi:MAG: helix-turn-helix transcriptional regulator [Clostridia bacterium]|nr:helix-turn-helix transcriptional regulator [Clostridia bacterium]
MREYSIDNDGFFYSYGHGTLSAEYFGVGKCYPHYELLYFTDGEGEIIVAGDHYGLRAGDVLLVRMGEHRVCNPARDNGLHCYTVRFSASALSPDILRVLEGLFPEGRVARQYSARALSGEAVSALSRLGTAKRLPYAERSLYVRAVLSELAVLLSLCQGVNNELDTVPLGVRVLRYIDDNIYSDLSLDTLARVFFVSKHYLCRAFKENNGISVHSYLTQRRVMHARELIKGGESAASAAYKVGFGDYSAFYRAYVKINGVSPTAENRGEA